jgi:hypothetical protein
MEYECSSGHVTERFFKSFRESDAAKEVTCEVCGEPARKIPSRILGWALYGNPDGWTNPSKTKRWSYKTVSQVEGNSSAAG